jgi:hypothetical protein
MQGRTRAPLIKAHLRAPLLKSAKAPLLKISFCQCCIGANQFGNSDIVEIAWPATKYCGLCKACNVTLILSTCIVEIYMAIVRNVTKHCGI